MNRRQAIGIIFAGFSGRFLGPLKWLWSPDSPKSLRRIEVNREGKWQEVPFEEIKSGDSFRIVGEPGYEYEASTNAVSSERDEDCYVMVSAMRKVAI